MLHNEFDVIENLMVSDFSFNREILRTYFHIRGLYEATTTFNRHMAEFNRMHLNVMSNVRSEDMYCRKMPIFPFKTFTDDVNFDVEKIKHDVFNSQTFRRDQLWYFQKRLAIVYDLQQRAIEFWAPHVDAIRAELDVLPDEDIGQDAAFDRRMREDAVGIDQRLITEQIYRDRENQLRVMAQDDPVAFAEYTAQLARQAAAAHEQRDPTEAEVREAIGRIDEAVRRRVPYFIPQEPSAEDKCALCFEAFDPRDQPYVPSTEHVELFNPLRAQEDYGEVVVDKECRRPGMAAVSCNFIRSDFDRDGDARAAEHRKHVFHYHCAAESIQYQRRARDPYRCILDITSVYKLGRE